MTKYAEKLFTTSKGCLFEGVAPELDLSIGKKEPHE